MLTDGRRLIGWCVMGRFVGQEVGGVVKGVCLSNALDGFLSRSTVLVRPRSHVGLVRCPPNTAQALRPQNL